MGVSLLHLRDMVAHGMTDKTFGPLRNFRKDVSLWTLQPFYYISETSHLLHRRDCTGEVHRCFCWLEERHRWRYRLQYLQYREAKSVIQPENPDYFPATNFLNVANRFLSQFWKARLYTSRWNGNFSSTAIKIFKNWDKWPLDRENISEKYSWWKYSLVHKSPRIAILLARGQLHTGLRQPRDMEATNIVHIS